jgi:uncharacterized protein (DUF1810 family)
MASTRLQRFHAAQDQSDSGIEAALAELRGTGKQQHWIWYVFPQLDGLGASSVSRHYAIQGRDEAVEYLRDGTLRSRLLEATRAVKERLREGLRLDHVMGSRIDSLKLVSSLTLFEHVARSLTGKNQGEAEGSAKDREDCETFCIVAAEVLSMADRQGFVRCDFTLQKLGA